MSSYRRVLLASHGTAGARAAEKLALSLACELHHLIVVPEFWAGMMGDDWLNNAVTRMQFGDYLEGQLARETDAELTRFRRFAGSRVLEQRIAFGKPDEALLEASGQVNYDAVVLGAPRPKGVSGLRSRMLTPRLSARLKAPLLVASHPDAG